MKVLRGIGAALVWLLATVVMLVAGLLCITLVLLPLGLPLMALGLRLYGYGVQLMIPRAPEVKRGMRKRLGLRRHGSVPGDLKRVRKRGKKSGRKVRKKLAGAFHS
jgi:hypothetical protein